ncbi:MAG: hypothetical protein PHG30_08990 [Eubacteriales bacterium]|nr:hypothetical protein [Eubacteriales bacterium]
MKPILKYTTRVFVQTLSGRARWTGAVIWHFVAVLIYGRGTLNDRPDAGVFCDIRLVIPRGFMTDIYDLITANRNEPAPKKDDVHFFSAMRTLLLCQFHRLSLLPEVCCPAKLKK